MAGRMVTRGFRRMLAEAAERIEILTAEDAVPLYGDADVIFVDVRESHESEAGTIPGSLHAPRGFLEFIADPDGAMHAPEFASGKRLILFCANGGRALLAACTLRDMGIERVAALRGGFTAWRQHDGPGT